MVSIRTAQTGKRIYNGASQSPNKGQVSGQGTMGYVARERRKQAKVKGLRQQGRPIAQPKGGDGKSDQRSGLAAQVLNGGRPITRPQVPKQGFVNQGKMPAGSPPRVPQGPSNMVTPVGTVNLPPDPGGTGSPVYTGDQTAPPPMVGINPPPGPGPGLGQPTGPMNYPQGPSAHMPGSNSTSPQVGINPPPGGKPPPPSPPVGINPPPGGPKTPPYPQVGINPPPGPGPRLGQDAPVGTNPPPGPGPRGPLNSSFGAQELRVPAHPNPTGPRGPMNGPRVPGQPTPPGGPPQAPPVPPNVQVTPDGILQLPYNQQFATQQLDAITDANDQLLGLKVAGDQQQLQYSRDKRLSEQDYAAQQKSTLNANAAGGTAFSSAYGTQTANNATAFANDMGDIEGQNAAFQQNQAAQRAAIQNQLNMSLQRYAQNYGNDLGPLAGLLGYGQYPTPMLPGGGIKQGPGGPPITDVPPPGGNYPTNPWQPPMPQPPRGGGRKRRKKKNRGR